MAFGVRKYKPSKAQAGGVDVKAKIKSLEAGTDEWIAWNIGNATEWLEAQHIIAGRKGPLQNDITKDDIIRTCNYSRSEFSWRWPLHTTEASPTDRVAFVGICNPFMIYTGGRFGGPLLEAAVTYDNTTRDFAAAVIANDPQGLRILYHSLTDDEREIGILPWHLEAGGSYRLAYGPDANEDEKMDSAVEEREFDFPQLGTPVYVKVKPRVTYVVEIDQVRRGRGAELVPDPALSRPRTLSTTRMRA